mgnify:CR=1 FL=1
MISVLMSVYEKENPEFLKKALDSIYAQSMKPDEIVLVEDGKLTEALEAVISDYPRLRILKLEENQQLGRALEAGLKVCRYELVARMDSDDIMMPKRLERQYRYMIENPHLAACGGEIAEFIDEDKMLREKSMPISPDAVYMYGKLRNPMNHMTVMFRKSAIEAVGGYRHFPGLEDYDLWIRLIMNGYKLSNLPEVLVKARIGEGFAKRRGGWKYFKTYHKLRREQYKLGYLSLYEYKVACIATFVMTMMPARWRDRAYAELRK